MKSIDIETLMAEADELIRQINAEALDDINESHRLEFETHTKKLEKIKSSVQGKIERNEKLNSIPGAEGIHEAILDIIKGMGEFQKYLS